LSGLVEDEANFARGSAASFPGTPLRPGTRCSGAETRGNGVPRAFSCYFSTLDGLHEIKSITLQLQLLCAKISITLLITIILKLGLNYK